MSRIGAECVSAPTDTRSAPAAAKPATVSSVTPPDASTSTSDARGWPETCRTASARSAGVKLSQSTTVAPASTASLTWSIRSHSTSTMRPGQRSRAAFTAAAMPVPPRWLSFTSTASERLPRWFVPPPARTAAFSSARRPGVVLRVSSTRVRGFAPVAASTKRRVRVATPERWQRKLSAVRSAVTNERSRPETRPISSPARRTSPSRRENETSSSPSTALRAAFAQATPASTPAERVTKAAVALASAGSRLAVRSPKGRRSSSRARRTARSTAGPGGSQSGRAPLEPSAAMDEPRSEAVGRFREVRPGVGAAALLASGRRLDEGARDVEQVAQLRPGRLRRRLRQRVPEPPDDHRRLGEAAGVAHEPGVPAHGFLQLGPHGGGALRPGRARQRKPARREDGHPRAGARGERPEGDVGPGCEHAGSAGASAGSAAVEDGVGDAGGEHHALEEGVGGEAVGAVHPRAGDLAGGPEAREGCRAVEIREDATAEVVGGGGDRQPLAGGVDADGLQRLVDRREAAGELGQPGAVEEDVVGTTGGEPGGDGPADDVA